MTAKFFLTNADLRASLERILEATWATFPQLAQNQIALTWIVYEPPYQVNTGGALSAEAFWQYRPQGASYRGIEPIEPAGLVQLFYLVAIQVWLEQGMVQPSPEISRALTDMVKDSSDDAASYLVDVLSGTTSGPSLPPGPLETWRSQRNIVNRYFQQLGWPELRSVNLNQKTWHNGPYGRERDFLGDAFENRNQLTTESTARLLHSIVGGVSVSSVRSVGMMDLMQRSLDPTAVPTQAEPIAGFIGAGLPQTARLWSKAGVSSQVSHDAAYVEAAGHLPYLLVVFTEGAAQRQNEDLIPFLSRQVFAAPELAAIAP
ncbi:serine hydrolase [soil metagenome]